MRTMRHMGRATLGLVALLAASGVEAKKDFGVDSRNQPVVTAGTALVPNCPNWSTTDLDSAAVNNSNYGCAVNSNLAAMIADPMDLIHGKSDQTTDTDNVIRAIKAWRDAPATSKVWTTTTRESSKGGGQ